ncbi:MAG: periplasmic heavy metal sensor [Verrucomicrobiae bacterium]|nr:periplasmic heavy metal sensor [Verrucomicrobiae bacterium]
MRLPRQFFPLMGGAILISAISAWAASRAALSRHLHSHEHQHGETAAGRSDDKARDFHAWMHSQLTLTPEQAIALEPFEHSFEIEKDRIGKEIQSAGLELADAVRDGNRDSPEIATALDRLNGARKELQKATLDHFFVMRDHLDPDQAQRLLQWTHDSLLH